jgi:hypothetical protein
LGFALTSARRQFAIASSLVFFVAAHFDALCGVVSRKFRRCEFANRGECGEKNAPATPAQNLHLISAAHSLYELREETHHDFARIGGIYWRAV